MKELNEAAYERVEDARMVLAALGMDGEHNNERSASSKDRKSVV